MLARHRGFESQRHMAVTGLYVPPLAKGGVISIGNFDGVHRGHQAMLTEVRRRAEAADRPAVIVTFDPHPITVLRPDICLPRLTTITTRTALLKSSGANSVVVLPVGTGLLQMSAQEFFDKVIVGELEATGVVEGVDFRFGKDRVGDCDLLTDLCEQAGLSLHVFPPVTSSNELISSTRIRRLIGSGHLSAATELLGHDYTLSGIVGHGAGRGSRIGVPTANLERIAELLPSNGVYCGQCVIAGKLWPAAVNIGGNPTFEDVAKKVECHIIGFSGDLYGQSLNIELAAQIREVISFANADQLVRQIHADLQSCKDIFRRRNGM